MLNIQDAVLRYISLNTDFLEENLPLRQASALAQTQSTGHELYRQLKYNRIVT